MSEPSTPHPNSPEASAASAAAGAPWAAPAAPSASASPAAPAAAALPAPTPARWFWPVTALLAAVAAGALALAHNAQQQVRLLEVELGKRQQESAQAAGEVRSLARQAESASREALAKMALLEARVAETSMQRSQFEDLLQSMARSRDENILADIEAAVRVAQQQSAITGSVEPMLLVLRQAEERLARYNQPRLERVRRALAQDLERVRAAGVADLPVVSARIDDLVRQVDELPLSVAAPNPAARKPAARAEGATVPTARGTAGMGGTTGGTGATSASAATGAAARAPSEPASAGIAHTLQQTWERLSGHVGNEARSLLRVTRIDSPEAMLIAPEQTWFLRENLKLRLLNARLALLSRQFDVAQSDLREALAALERYFDRSARRTVLAGESLRQVIAQARLVGVPRAEATLAAITAASAGAR